ncbi:MAG TPA: metal ABC transporter substrate-binding protein [Dehalococcoidia bacterium]|nr:metal ABC transporter substrate-binding protein [Dehalococcoidia bacterium]
MRTSLRALAMALPLIPALLLAACGSGNDNPTPNDSRLRVLTTVSPITSLVENIGGTKILLEGIVPEGVNSHTYEPPVSVAKSISNADLIILNGLHLEDPTLELANANKKSSAQLLMLGESAITPDQYKFDFSFPRDEGHPNPHLWPDPVLALKYAQLVHDKLIEMDSANSAYYDANFSTLRQGLQLLDQKMREAVSTVPAANRKLLTYHDSWAYWADRYGFSVIGAIQPSDFSEPSSRDVVNIINQIKAEKVPAIFGSEVFPSPVLKQIANETGAKFVDKLADDNLPGDPGDKLHSYTGLMVENMRAMIPALGGDASAMDAVPTDLVFHDGPSPAKYAH